MVVEEEVVGGLQVAWVVQGLLVVLVIYLVVLASTLVLLGLVVASQAAKVSITCVVTEDGELLTRESSPVDINTQSTPLHPPP